MGTKMEPSPYVESLSHAVEFGQKVFFTFAMKYRRSIEETSHHKKKRIEIEDLNIPIRSTWNAVCSS